MRRSWTLAALAAGGLLAAGASAPAATAADDCPNAAVRAQQGVQHLPNCYAYEKVTGAQKLGSLVEADSVIAPDGSAVSIRSTVSMTLEDLSGHSHLGVARREADGWSVDMQTDTRLWGTIRKSMLTDYPYWSGASDDMRSMVFSTQHPLDPGDQGGAPVFGTADLYVSRPGQEPRWLTAPPSGVQTASTGTGPVPVGVSPDVSRVIFETTRVMDPDVDNTVRPHVWMREDGKPLEIVDRMPNGAVSNATVTYSSSFAWGVRRAVAERHASGDARRVVFVSSQDHSPAQLYARIDLGTPDVRTVLVSANGAGTPCPDTPVFEHITEDGRYVRFTCAASLVPGAPAGGGAYVRDLDTGTLTFDEPEVFRGEIHAPQQSSKWTRPDGSFTVEISGGKVFRTDNATGVEDCVSCRPGTTLGQGNGGGVDAGVQGGAGVTVNGLVFSTGEVVFSTLEALVPGDTNGQEDVYLWKDGTHHLLSTGTSPNGDRLGGVAEDGSTVSFTTSAALVPEDRDAGERDIYVLRRNGGFFRPAAPGACTSGCQGPANLPPSQVAPLSVSFADRGDLDDKDAEPISVSGSRSVRGTSLKVKVRIPAAGRVSVSGSGLRSTSRTLKRATTATLTVKLSERSQRTLRRKGSVKVKGSVRFVPADGPAQTTRVNLTYRQKKASDKKGSSRGVATATSGKAAR